MSFAMRSLSVRQKCRGRNTESDQRKNQDFSLLGWLEWNFFQG